MVKTIRKAWERFFGIGEASVAIPVLDGALKPNNILEDATVLLEHGGLEDIAIGSDGLLYAAAGNEVLQVGATGAIRPVARFGSPIHAIASFAHGLAAASSEGLSFTGGSFDGKKVDALAGRPLACVNALHDAGDGTLLVSDGSARPEPDWRRDLLEKGRTGRVLRFSPATGECEVIAQGLAYCYGVCADGKRVLASESWAHRVRAFEGSRVESGITELPGYPSRLARASGGGFWLTVFAARTQLVEFVLREDEFREEMMRTVEPRYWIAPYLLAGTDYREALQQGEVRQMGILKPWAPPRSYGLVIRLGANFLPQYSLHSRVGGRHHGITAVAESGEFLYVLSKGSERILQLPLSGLDSRG